MINCVRAAAAAALALAAPLAAQQPAPAAGPQVLRAQPSTRATTTVSMAVGRDGPVQRIAIDYGQPHLRGREVGREVVPMDSVWRLGANEFTTLTADVDLVVGGTRVPKGRYTLHALPTRAGWKLIVNRGSAQQAYDAAQDLARIDLRVRDVRDPVESLSIALVPQTLPQQSTELPRGTLRIQWGRVELTTDWQVAQ
jgi:hypothetical protein